jgi:hypothetical protein
MSPLASSKPLPPAACVLLLVVIARDDPDDVALFLGIRHFAFQSFEARAEKARQGVRTPENGKGH